MPRSSSPRPPTPCALSPDVYRWVDHTAEVELHVEAGSQEDVFAEALTAFAELVSREDRGERVEHEVTAEAQDDATLLAEWLGEFVFLAETEDFVPERLKRIELDGGRLRAVVAGHRGRPAHLVKAVTYHGLEFARSGDVWRAKVVLDV
jgi:SHS2 domain-containing protein